MQIASYVTLLGGGFVFLFIFWKRLKEDLSYDIIFRLGSYILTGLLLGWVISLYSLLNFIWIWLIFLGGLMGLIVGIFRLNLKFYELFESYVISILPWISFVFLKHSVTHSSFSSFLGFLVILFIIFLSYWVESHYKNFSWYKSGKIGFSGLVTLLTIFIVRFSLAISGISVLSFADKFEAPFSGIGIVSCLLVLYLLSRSE